MLRLEKFTLNDIPLLLSWLKSEEEVLMFTGSVLSYPPTVEEFNRLIDGEGKLIYKVIDDDSDKVIGHCELIDINVTHKGARVCRVIIGDKSKRDEGRGKQIINRLKEISKYELGLEHLSLRVFENNRAAIRCYQSCGFKLTGKIHNTVFMDGTYYSTLLMHCVL